MPTDADIADLWAVHRSPELELERALRSARFDDTRSWVDPKGYRLSDRIWQNKAEVRRKIDDRIRQAIARGEDAISLAKDLEQYLNPRYAPLRTVDGRIVRRGVDPRKGVYTSTPRGGTGSYPARRLARTEITRAHGEAAVLQAEALGQRIKWSLSPRHLEPDVCDDHAGRDNGEGPGVYRPRKVPVYPPHPQCLCTLRIHSVETVDQVVERLRQKYGLDRRPLESSG